MKPGIVAGITATGLLLLAVAVRADNLSAEQAFQSGNYAAAMQRWQSRAANGDAAAQYNAAIMLLEGPGTSRDPQAALDLLRHAAAQSSPDALFALAFLYAEGQHVARDDVRAAELYRAAAESGHAAARYNLAMLYRDHRVRGGGAI